MRIIFAVAALVSVSACATSISPEMQARIDAVGATAQPAAAPSGLFAVADQRHPDSLKVRQVPIGWAGGFSCNVGISQLGDDGFAPDRLARLENALAKAFPYAAKGAALLVRRYDIYINRGAEADAVAMGAAMGSVGVFGVGGTPDANSLQVWRAPKCGQEKMAGGWFSTADLSNNTTPITVDIDVTVFGRSHVVNAALSPELPAKDFLAISTRGASPALNALLQQAMDKANNRLIDAIDAKQRKSDAS
jgi:hypothetical protein